MSLGEFELIERFFHSLGARRPDVVLGVGDDAAVIAVPAGKRLVAATDTLVDGIHFPRGSAPRSVGHRSLAINVSDLAAMGAKPAWATLALTLPAVDEAWLADFSAGFDALAQRYDVALVGGDTTSGPLSVTVTLLGTADSGGYLLRSGAAPGDRIFVSGSVGDAAAGLAVLQSRLQGGSPESRDDLRRRFLFPEPRVELGGRLLGIASGAIDISDGLAADVGKLAAASGGGARIETSKLPLSSALLDCAGPEAARRFALTGGDDYELCFTVPESRLQRLAAELPASRWPHVEIGVITPGSGIGVYAGETRLELPRAGFDHFAR